MKKDNKYIEVDGKSVEDAILKAMKILSAGRNEIKVKVMCEEKKGLFGMDGAKPAKIRVELMKKNNDKKH